MSSSIFFIPCLIVKSFLVCFQTSKSVIFFLWHWARYYSLATNFIDCQKKSCHRSWHSQFTYEVGFRKEGKSCSRKQCRNLFCLTYVLAKLSVKDEVKMKFRKVCVAIIVKIIKNWMTVALWISVSYEVVFVYLPLR